jgi:hypothetical protein
VKYLRMMIMAMLLAFAAMSVCGYEGGDTGTYEILDYKVTLTPNSDGNVNIDYYQKWRVTGGDIPWMTIGTPNENYTIKSHSAAVAGATEANSGGWSGVRLNLDKDYLPGDTFEVRLSINQSQLFTTDASGYKLDFTPGWYDRAAIDNLKIMVKHPKDTKVLWTTPSPTSKSDGSLIWSKKNLSPGEMLPVSLTFSKDALPNGIPAETEAPQGNSSAGGDASSWFFAYIGCAIVFILIVLGLAQKNGKYTGGGISHGGIGRGSSCVSSCACACVSCACACACACAGGGGAGCTRKSRHTCRVCGDFKDLRSLGTAKGHGGML